MNGDHSTLSANPPHRRTSTPRWQSSRSTVLAGALESGATASRPVPRGALSATPHLKNDVASVSVAEDDDSESELPTAFEREHGPSRWQMPEERDASHLEPNYEQNLRLARTMNRVSLDWAKPSGGPELLVTDYRYITQVQQASAYQIRWLHLQRECLSFHILKSVLARDKDLALSRREQKLTDHLLNRVLKQFEHHYPAGDFCVPNVSVYRSKDAARQTPDKTSSFLNFPYFVVAKPKLPVAMTDAVEATEQHSSLAEHAKVDAIAPVVTSEAVTLNLLDRLGNGVAGNATFDVIRLYDLRLQKLMLHAKKRTSRPSRRLLSKINDYQEEIEIVHDVIKEQKKVVKQFKMNLNPRPCTASSVNRSLNFAFEETSLNEIIRNLRAHEASCMDLQVRAKQLAIRQVQLVEAFQDGSNLAILAFTLMTIIFLPLSTVAGFYGMNFADFPSTTRGDASPQQFWKVAAPLTCTILVICLFGVFWRDMRSRGKKAGKLCKHPLETTYHSVRCGVRRHQTEQQTSSIDLANV